jgi:glycosyltransferase involved in cell wall biosynthesis
MSTFPPAEGAVPSPERGASEPEGDASPGAERASPVAEGSASVAEGASPVAGGGASVAESSASAVAGAAVRGQEGRPVPSRTHLVLIPSFDTGPLLRETVMAALARWAPVWVVIDGSRDGSQRLLDSLLDPASPQHAPDLRVIELARNSGKGAALLAGLTEALHAGFSHALTMDADGQHPADLIPAFMARSRAEPDAMILGQPVFDQSAPQVRLRGRKVSNALADIETFRLGVADSLFGFRVYPIMPLVQLMLGTRWMRRFDFDVEAVVRLVWHGVRSVNLDAPVRYLRPDEGGVTHFRYGRDNLLLAWMHTRLMAGYLVRRLTGRPPGYLRADRDD